MFLTFVPLIVVFVILFSVAAVLIVPKSQNLESKANIVFSSRKSMKVMLVLIHGNFYDKGMDTEFAIRFYDMDRVLKFEVKKASETWFRKDLQFVDRNGTKSATIEISKTSGTAIGACLGTKAIKFEESNLGSPEFVPESHLTNGLRVYETCVPIQVNETENLVKGLKVSGTWNIWQRYRNKYTEFKTTSDSLINCTYRWINKTGYLEKNIAKNEIEWVNVSEQVAFMLQIDSEGREYKSMVNDNYGSLLVICTSFVLHLVESRSAGLNAP